MERASPKNAEQVIADLTAAAAEAVHEYDQHGAPAVFVNHMVALGFALTINLVAGHIVRRYMNDAVAAGMDPKDAHTAGMDAIQAYMATTLGESIRLLGRLGVVSDAKSGDRALARYLQGTERIVREAYAMGLKEGTDAMHDNDEDDDG